MNLNRSISVALIGARMHYAVPRILNHAGVLERLYTDISIDHGIVSLLNKIPGMDKFTAFRRIKGRHVEGVKNELITAFELIGFKYSIKLKIARTSEERTAAYLWVADEFARSIKKCGLGMIDSIYGFNGASLGIFVEAKSRGISTILEQTSAPKRIELEILSRQKTRDDESNNCLDGNLNEFIKREELEWDTADSILCASDFVRTGLIRCGVPAHKCTVIPYGVDLARFKTSKPKYLTKEFKKNKSITVLFIGSVRTQKGIWTLLAAMRDLQDASIECRVIGPIVTDNVALTNACPSNVKIVGPIPRSEISGELHRADIFCLPSLCEGSATVIYEALAAGLPVVTTNNSGSIVRHGHEGLIVDADDKEQLAQALLQLATDYEMRYAMSQSAIERSEFGSFSAYSDRLIEALKITPATNLGIACV